MGEAMFRPESPVEYFKELVDGALVHQGLVANELTSDARVPGRRAARHPAGAGP
jgi:hypothetical protein